MKSNPCVWDLEIFATRKPTTWVGFFLKKKFILMNVMNLRKILFHLIPHINVCWWMLASTTNQSLMFVGWSCNCLHNKSGIFVIACATVNDRSSWSLMTYCYDCQWLAAPWSTTINGRLLVIVDNCCQPVDHAHWTLVTFPLSPFSFFNFPFFLLIPLDFSFLFPPSFGKK